MIYSAFIICNTKHHHILLSNVFILANNRFFICVDLCVDVYESQCAFDYIHVCMLVCVCVHVCKHICVFVYRCIVLLFVDLPLRNLLMFLVEISKGCFSAVERLLFPYKVVLLLKDYLLLPRQYSVKHAGELVPERRSEQSLWWILVGWKSTTNTVLC